AGHSPQGEQGGGKTWPASFSFCTKIICATPVRSFAPHPRDRNRIASRLHYNERGSAGVKNVHKTGRLASSCGNASWLQVVQAISEVWWSQSYWSVATSRWFTTISRMDIARPWHRACS